MQNTLAVLITVAKGDSLLYFSQAMDSIFTQSYKSFDCFLGIDGKVNIEIDEYINNLLLQHKNLIVYRQTSNQGLADTLNALIEKAIKNSNYKYYCRMDADDISHPNRFIKQLAHMEEHTEIDILGSNCNEINENNKVIFEKKLQQSDAQLKKDIIKRNPFVHPSVIIRDRVFLNGERYPTQPRRVEDLKFWVELAAKGYQFSNLAEPLISFRISNNFYSKRGRTVAYSDFKVRIAAIFKLRKFSLRNFGYAFVNLGMRLAPRSVIKMIYRFCR